MAGAELWYKGLDAKVFSVSRYLRLCAQAGMAFGFVDFVSAYCPVRCDAAVAKDVQDSGRPS